MGAFARSDITQGPNPQFSDSNGLHLNPLSHSTCMDICISSFPLDVTGKPSLKQMFSILKKNESHWLQVSTSKLLGDYSDNIKMPNESFGQDVQVKIEKKVSSTIEFCIFELAYNLGHILELYNVLVQIKTKRDI